MSDSAKSSPAHSYKGELYDEVPVTPDQTVIAGWLKFRDQKKWKLRWGVVTKLSPAADCLHLQLYRDNKDRYKQGMTKASLSLQHFLGTESDFTLDKESNTIAIICRDLVVTIAFDSRERLIRWQLKIQYNLGESIQFLVQICTSPPKSKLNIGPAKLHIQNETFCLTCGIPPKLICYWQIKHLRRYGVVDGKFCFEGGSLCGKGEGLFVFLTDECEQISWHMHMASEGKLILKRRYVSRNMSVTESPSRRYLQRTSHSHLSSIGNLSSLQDNQSFAMYEWASEESTKDSDSEIRNSSHYLCALQTQAVPSQWTESNVETFTKAINSHFDENNSDPNYEEYDATKTFLKFDSCVEMKPKDEMGGIVEKLPERPPKPLKFRPVECDNTVIESATEKLIVNDNVSNDKDSITESHKNQHEDATNLYDSPKSFCSKIQPKPDEHVCACLLYPRKVLNEFHSQTSSNNYDVPPRAVPINTRCSCTSKMQIIVQSEEYHNRHKFTNTCPCQHFITCWPYNWLQLAYCRRGNSVQDTSVPFRVIGCSDTNPDNPSPIYAQVDLSKKSKYKHSNEASSDPSRPAEPKPKLPDKSQVLEPNNSYTNLYFENTLKYYENSKRLIKNMLPDKETNTQKCSKDELFVENYIIMNPLGRGEQSKSTAITKLPMNVEFNKSFLSRQRSDSLGSSGSIPVSTFMKPDDLRKFDDNRTTDDLSRCKSRSSVNRNSSSSNDSGFSFASLRSHIGDTTDSEQVANLLRNNSFSTEKISTKGSNGIKLVDPLKDISFKFHLGSVPNSIADIPLCHQRTSKKAAGIVKSDGVSPIPFIDGQSTSSETSDISDYIETLSMSSHSSSEAALSHARIPPMHHSSSTVLRPRSGKEYEEVNRVLLQ